MVPHITMVMNLHMVASMVMQLRVVMVIIITEISEGPELNFNYLNLNVKN
jgi:hypothetical protein